MYFIVSGKLTVRYFWLQLTPLQGGDFNLILKVSKNTPPWFWWKELFCRHITFAVGGGQMHRVLMSVSFFLSSDFSITSYPIPVLHDTLTRLLQRNVIIWPAETVCLRPGVLSDDMVSWHLLQGGSDKPLGSGEGNGRKSSQSFNVCLFHKSAPRFDVVLSDVA